MDDFNIKTLLFYKKDIDSLLELCEEDDDAMKICQDESFWQDKYESEFIPFHKFYNDYKLNIIEYGYALKCEIDATEALRPLLPRGSNEATYHIYVNNPKVLDIFYNLYFYEELVKKFLPILISFKDGINNFDKYALAKKGLSISILYINSARKHIYKLILDDKEYSITTDDMEYLLYEISYKKILTEISTFDIVKGKERIEPIF